MQQSKGSTNGEGWEHNRRCGVRLITSTSMDRAVRCGLAITNRIYRLCQVTNAELIAEARELWERRVESFGEQMDLDRLRAALVGPLADALEEAEAKCAAWDELRTEIDKRIAVGEKYNWDAWPMSELRLVRDVAVGLLERHQS